MLSNANTWTSWQQSKYHHASAQYCTCWITSHTNTVAAAFFTGLQLLLARLQTLRALIFSRVCLSVCLSVCLGPALRPFNVDWFSWNLVTRTLLWSSLVATIMVQIGCATTFWKFQKFSKSQNSNFKILVHLFLHLCLLCTVKKFGLYSNKTDGGDRFWSLPPWRFRQWHCCSSTTLNGIFWFNHRRGGVQQSQLGGVLKWGRSELGVQSGRKNQPACSFLSNQPNFQG